MEFLFRGIRYRLRCFVSVNEVGRDHIRCAVRRRFRAVSLAERNIGTCGGRFFFPSNFFNDLVDSQDCSIVVHVRDVGLQIASGRAIRFCFYQPALPDHVYFVGRLCLKGVASDDRGSLVAFRNKDQTAWPDRFGSVAFPFRTKDSVVTCHAASFVVVHAGVDDVFVQGGFPISHSSQGSFPMDLLGG